MNRRDFLRAGAALGLVPAARLARAVPDPPASATGTDLVLNSNENALGLSPAARQAMVDAVAIAHRYPDAAREGLTVALAARHGVRPEQIVLGNGSSEILQMVVQAATSPNAILVLADPTFEAVSRYQRPLPYRTERVPLDAAFRHDLERMREVTRRDRRPALVYLCNPNNPTATLTPSADVDAWIVEAPETVTFLVDEAYFDYVDAPGYWSASRWIDEHPNVIVARTFSKIHAMAGLRLGYALTHADTARRLTEFMSSDNANAAALAAGLASLDDAGWMERSRAANLEAKATVHACLDELGLDYLPSHANFLMHGITGDLGTYITRMRERGVHVGRPFPPLLSYNRLSLGLPAEMERFAAELRGFRRRGWV
jgi:histidinol-phosphate aminotransferase